MRLSGRRQVGMAANPICILQIEAYERKLLVTFSAWETEQLLALDDAVRAVWASGAPKPGGKHGSDRTATEVSIKDTAGMKGLFGRIKDRVRAGR